MTSLTLTMLAVGSLFLAGCGKTDSALVVVREDPRTGPILLLRPRDDAPLPVAYPRWDAPTAANGFEPVPRVDRHPPMDHP